MKSARELTSLLATTVPLSSPSSGLRRRIVGSVSSDAAPAKQGFRWGIAWAVAASLAAVVAVTVDQRVQTERDQARQESARLQAEVISQTTQLARMNEALSILNSVETIEVNFGPNQQPQPAGKVFVSAERGVLFIASRLPAAPAGKTYEMWIVPKQGAPAPAGLFQSGADGVAIHVQRGPVDLAAAGAVAVTLENEGGSSTPTPPILIAAALPPQRPAR